MDIVLASRNKKKIAELNTLLSASGIDGLRILSLDDIGYNDDTEETGTTFEENSLIKASVPARLGYIGIADDSGLCVDALDGAPGIYSARYSGEGANDRKNIEKLLSELETVPDAERTARFVCVVSCVFPEAFGEVMFPDSVTDMTGKYSDITGDLRSFCIRGECEGTILHEKHGENGFGYDPVFYIPDKEKTFAELSNDEKNSISHRGRAMRAFATALSEIMKGK